MEFLTRVNDMVPVIFKNIIKEYDFNIMKTKSMESVLYKDDYGIVLCANRDYVDIKFLKKEENIINMYWIEPFMMQNLTDEDKSNEREENNMVDRLVNYLLIYEKVLQTKWKNILIGQMDWVDEYKKISMCVIRELNAVEYKLYKELFL